MQQLIDFVNHGTFPFVGRASLSRRLLDFALATPQAHALRAGLVVGEAGVGKSRLIDELAPRCRERGLLVLRVKFHPGSLHSFCALLVRALTLDPEASRLLSSEPAETVSEVTAALERLARLRPVVLIAEDVHLLEGEALSEFALAIGALADEPITLLATARPGPLPVRATLAAALLLERTIEGLTREEVENLWQELFNEMPEQGLIDSLIERTGGNPLAVRSALRGAVVLDDAEEGHVHLRFDPVRFTAALDTNVRLLAAGMTAHLSEEEKLEATTLASLGEVFSPEAARHLLPDADRTISRLIVRGIIAESAVVAVPMTTSPVASLPFAFTHTLLHRHLAEQTSPSVRGLVELIASGAALYSMQAVGLLERKVDDLTSDQSDSIHRAVEQLLILALALDSTVNWQEAMIAWRCAEALAAREGELGEIAPEVQQWQVIQLLVCRLTLDRRARYDEDASARIDELLRLTAPPVPKELQATRLEALRHRYRRDEQRALVPDSREIEDEVAQMTAANPSIRFSHEWVHFMTAMAARAYRFYNIPLLRHVETMVLDAATDPSATPEWHATVRTLVEPYFLTIYETKEELAQRRAVLDSLGKELQGNSRWWLPALTICHETLDVENGLPLAVRLERSYSTLGLWRNRFNAALTTMVLRSVSGASFEEIVAQAVEMMAQPPATYETASTLAVIANTLAQIAAVRNAGRWWRSAVRQLGMDDADTLLLGVLVLNAEEMELEKVREVVYRKARDPEGSLVGDRVSRILGAVEGSVRDAEVAALLALPVVTFRDSVNLVCFLNVAAAVGLCDRRTILDGARRGIDGLLEWYAERGLHHLIRALVEQQRRWIEDETRAVWEKRVAEFAARSTGSDEGVRGDGRHSITMLGRVGITTADGVDVPVRGGRMRSILGLLVADEMTRTRLGKTEFYMLAAGDEGKEFELARKAVNMAISSLRKTLGDDAFLRDSDTIRLNRSRISVDLLEAWEALQEASSALREGSLSRARSAMLVAAGCACGEVPFPSLYDSYFEAAREDFENRLRTTLVDVSRALLREGDAAGAEELLRIGFSWLPDDEQIGDLLRRALQAGGNRTEAELVRFRNAMEV